MMELFDLVWANPLGKGLVIGIPLVTVLMFIGGWATWWERKFAGRIQNRLGPTIVGPAGFLQPLADLFKMLRKEVLVPRDADRPLFLLAPFLAVFVTLIGVAVMPLDDSLVISDTEIGLLWLLGCNGLLVFPVWIAGWASNNKYALFGGMRAVAQGISYEIPLVLAAMIPVVYAGSLNINEIIRYQAEHGWFFVWPIGPGFFAFFIFFLSSLAEANRIPFDIPEAESELISGPTVEYTGIFWGMFPMVEYIHTFVSAIIASALFLGGWSGPGPDGMHWLVGKACLLFVFIYWLRWSLVRFRSDQLMRLCWVWLVPISLLLLIAAALAKHLMLSGGAPV
jgi:NADH-quinone oxidoreductase subunit H